MQLFGSNTSSPIADSIKADMIEFYSMVKKEGMPLQQIGVSLTLEEILEMLRRVYQL